MTTIALRPHLEERLRPEAERRQTTIDDLVNEWLEDQLWQEWHRQIVEEAQRFRAQHSILRAQYDGQYIAMRAGIVIDHDADLSALHQRVRAQYGDAPILIAPVTSQLKQSFKLRSPRRARIEA